MFKHTSQLSQLKQTYLGKFTTSVSQHTYLHILTTQSCTLTIHTKETTHLV